uniref:Lipoprotein n=1 Tax=Dechloromonas aromatica (strain RCB) TaxID=159087 RepID=Q47E28_DECAR
MTLRPFIFSLLLLASVSIPALASTTSLPKSIMQQIPAGYEVISTAEGNLDEDQLPDFLVALGRKVEVQFAKKNPTGIIGYDAQPRPLLIFIQNKDGTYRLAKRNDHLILRMNEGGQCDPFEDGEDGLVINKRFFTVQNSVACGQHWSLYYTFKYSKELKDWIFHKEISETWILNPRAKNSDDEALVRGGSSVISAKKNAPVRFENYRPKN